MPAYPSGHYSVPATYVLATKNPRTNLTSYELVHYEQAADAPCDSISAVLAVAALRETPVHDHVFFADAGRWVNMNNLIYMEELAARHANVQTN